MDLGFFLRIQCHHFTPAIIYLVFIYQKPNVMMLAQQCHTSPKTYTHASVNLLDVAAEMDWKIPRVHRMMEDMERSQGYPLS